MKPPNILLLTADGHRWDTGGYAGNAHVSTPTLDALARHGVLFTQAICQFPARAPSRATLLTGQYPSRHGVRDESSSVPLDWLTFPRLLRKAGYHTGAIGATSGASTPVNYGFDVMQPSERPTPGGPAVERPPQNAGGESADGESTSTEDRDATTWIGNQAVRFIQGAREPFFVWVAFSAPESSATGPMSGRVEPALPQPLDGWEAPPPQRLRDLAAYYGALGLVDRQIGRIMATLAGRGFTNNVVVYTSDRGCAFAPAQGRDALGEAMLRVPLIVSGLAGQRRGERHPALAELTDIAPTLLDIAGLPRPAEMQGNSLAPIVTGKSESARDAAFAEGPGGFAAARDERYKFIEHLETDENALFDLEADPHERHNVMGQLRYAREQARLARALRRKR